jgi:hypothetical protein
MKGLDKGGQGPTLGCCAIVEEEEEEEWIGAEKSSTTSRKKISLGRYCNVQLYGKDSWRCSR